MVFLSLPPRVFPTLFDAQAPPVSLEKKVPVYPTLSPLLQVSGIWFAKDMASLNRPDRREKVKVDREAATGPGRLGRTFQFTRAIAEVGRRRSETTQTYSTCLRRKCFQARLCRSAPRARCTQLPESATSMRPCTVCIVCTLQRGT